MPKPNGFLMEADLCKEEAHFPLTVAFCGNCTLMQLKHVVNPSEMFTHYYYVPSTSTTMRKHFRNLAHGILAKHAVGNRLVVDIGSNDGTLLGFFQAYGAQILGVDPASNLAASAEQSFIPTVCNYFSTEVAREIVKNHGRAKVVTATNVLGHIDEVHDFCKAVKILLEDQGVLVVEVPYLLNLLMENQFDTIYHEHLSYFSVGSLLQLFGAHEMNIVDIERTSVHGGSIQVTVQKHLRTASHSPKVESFLERERVFGLHTEAPYLRFADSVHSIKHQLLGLIAKIKASDGRIVGYGASAKGNMLLNYCGIRSDVVDYIVDSIPAKQGKFTPGTHIPIYSEEKLGQSNAEYALLLAWNYEEEILAKRADFRSKGGRFIKFVPEVEIV